MGSKRWACEGKPLYGGVNDTNAGDVTGDGVSGTLHIARP
jgi:predicted lipoprotein with Yx(FWY)xxD motif